VHVDSRTRPARRVIAAILIVGVLEACSGSNADKAIDTTVSGAAAPSSTAEIATPPAPVVGPLVLTASDLDGFEKGLRREIELVRAAQERASRATTPEARGEAIQAQFEDRTIADAAPASGLSAERYKLVRETLHEILETLDFQGKISGPKSMDTARAGDAMRARLRSDPYTALDPAGAAALKSRMDRIVSIYVEYVNLTAVAG